MPKQNSFAIANRDILLSSYKAGESTYVIAEKLQTNASRVRRALKFLGIQLRDKSEAQALVLETGRSDHPTKGTRRDEATKIKISEKIVKSWESLSQDERERRSEMAKEQWNDMTEQEKQALIDSAHEAVRLAAKEGSKMEKYLQIELEKAGFACNIHMKGLIVNSNLELDFFLPDLMTAIEVDGPSHFLPIWGEEKLKKNMKADAEKSGLILNAGYNLIRVKVLKATTSNKLFRDCASKVIAQLKKLKPGKKPKVYEIELS